MRTLQTGLLTLMEKAHCDEVRDQVVHEGQAVRHRLYMQTEAVRYHHHEVVGLHKQTMETLVEMVEDELEVQKALYSTYLQ